ncbi:uncharacterized protein LOC128414838 isoform X2 [Podarcis raffonei]|uniref:uncharacterized protein LOC128414838 isoform X2 n=1 Tax=Podarcis raffonei TaxID=65483 RepID=UPI00232994B1|nr:uncharacterized protein LOC128414838 isoform X2 [Podarcis raffonei]
MKSVSLCAALQRMVMEVSLAKKVEAECGAEGGKLRVVHFSISHPFALPSSPPPTITTALPRGLLASSPGERRWRGAITRGPASPRGFLLAPPGPPGKQARPPGSGQARTRLSFPRKQQRQGGSCRHYLRCCQDPGALRSCWRWGPGGRRRLLAPDPATGEPARSWNRNGGVLRLVGHAELLHQGGCEPPLGGPGPSVPPCPARHEERRRAVSARGELLWRADHRSSSRRARSASGALSSSQRKADAGPCSAAGGREGQRARALPRGPSGWASGVAPARSLISPSLRTGTPRR